MSCQQNSGFFAKRFVESAPGGNTPAHLDGEFEKVLTGFYNANDRFKTEASRFQHLIDNKASSEFIFDARCRMVNESHALFDLICFCDGLGIGQQLEC